MKLQECLDQVADCMFEYHHATYRPLSAYTGTTQDKLDRYRADVIETNERLIKALQQHKEILIQSLDKRN